MRALLLAGGKATRLRPLTERTPKAMTPLLGRPFLEHMLAWLVRHDVRDLTLLLGFLPDPIRQHFGDGHDFGVKLTYLVEHEPLGSGGAIKQLESELTEPFFALNADIFTDMDLDAMAAAHRQAGATVSIGLSPVADPTAYGVAKLDDNGWIHQFVEKPTAEAAPSNLINNGVWLFEPAAVTRIPKGRFSMVERELFPDLAEAGSLFGVTTDAYWMDAGTPERYLQLHRDLLAGRAAGGMALVERVGWPGLLLQPVGGDPRGQGAAPDVPADATLEGDAVIGAGSRVGGGARLVSPVSLGVGVTVGDAAVIADSVLWDGCLVGANAAVRGSILASGCVVGTGARVTDSILGEGVHVAAGAIVESRAADPGSLLT